MIDVLVTVIGFLFFGLAVDGVLELVFWKDRKTLKTLKKVVEGMENNVEK